MKHLLLTTIAAVVLVGCGESVPDISIHDAAEKGNLEAVKQHLAAGTDVNAKDRFDGTPLLHAVGGGRNLVAELLIAKGADVNAKGYRERTALHGAANGSWREIAELLIAKGADVNTRDDVGKTPLDWAATKSKKETSDLIRKHGGKTGEELKGAGN